MSAEQDRRECEEVVLQFCHAMNEWEVKQGILHRIRDGLTVFAKPRAKVEGLTIEGQLEVHAQIFGQYVVPRKRTCDSLPGEPKSFNYGGSYAGASAEGIEEVSFPKPDLAEVVCNWCCMGTRRESTQTKFILRRCEGQWMIDKLGWRNRGNERWEPAYL